MEVRKKNYFKIILSTVVLACATHGLLVYAETWSQYISELRSEALTKGIRPEIFDAAFAGIKEPNRKVLRFDRTQPEHRLTYLQYRNTRADRGRIRLGQREYQKHKALLDAIGEKYNVNPCVIVSLWGMETSYGHFMGSFPVIHALATLGYNSPRSAYFRSQLFIGLRILNEGHVDLQHFKGEWAGASGHPQFMPSSWDAYAVDYENHGRRDIWTSLGDAFASIANYLTRNGWQLHQPFSVEVTLPSNIDPALLTTKVSKPVSQWLQMGVRSKGDPLPNDNNASVISPDGGPAYMVFSNFKSIMAWNHSTYYAGTVGYMAEQICHSKLN